MVQRGFGRGREPFPCLCSFAHPFSSSTMLGVWLRPKSGGDWRWFPTVASAVAHLKDKGTAIWPTHVSCAAQRGSTRNGWCFRSTDPNAADAEEEAPAPPLANDPRHLATTAVGFFTPTSALRSCGCCGEKLLGDILLCSGCNHRVHALCSHGPKCFKCVCRICDSPPGDVMRPCKVCKHRVHAGCAVPVPYRIEVVCKHCILKSPVKVPPIKKKFRRYFKPTWQVGRPWLMHANGVMWCIACRAYPQPGMHKAWQTGTRSFCCKAVLEHSNSGLHAVALALWESGGISSTVIGGLPEQVRMAIFGVHARVPHCEADVAV